MDRYEDNDGSESNYEERLIAHSKSIEQEAIRACFGGSRDDFEMHRVHFHSFAISTNHDLP